MLAIVSHDLRNPLAVILTAAASQIARAPADDYGRLVRKQAELKYLEIAISKTAGPRELEAWGWLMQRLDTWRAEQR